MPSLPAPPQAPPSRAAPFLSPIAASPEEARRRQRRKRKDRWALHLVRMGGLVIVLSILAIALVILWKIFPLFRSPSWEAAGTLSVPGMGEVLSTGTDEYREVAFLIHSTGVKFISLSDHAELASPPGLDLGGAWIVRVSNPSGTFQALLLSDQRVLGLDLVFSAAFPQGAGGPRQVSPRIKVTELARLGPNAAGAPVTALAACATGGRAVVAAAAGSQVFWIAGAGGEEESEERVSIGKDAPGATGGDPRAPLLLPVRTGSAIREAVLGEDGLTLFLATEDQSLVALNVADPPAAVVLDQTRVAEGLDRVTALGTLLGGITVIAGTAQGRVSSWQLVRSETGHRELALLNRFDSHEAPVTHIAASERDKSFLTTDSNGQLKLHYGTSGQTLLKSIETGMAPGGLAMAPKADGFLVAGKGGALHHWKLQNPHPEISLKTLFEQVWYESYREPALTWQSTSGSQAFESKFSLTPLILGTLKGTFYAMLFSVPLALLGALYASQFMHPNLKAVVKPGVEIMAALPSVVLGFLAGLWLAPLVEGIAPACFLAVLIMPASILAACLAWEFACPQALRRRIPQGFEIYPLALAVLAAGGLSYLGGSWFNSTLLGGDYRNWLLETFSIKYDQRNSLVVGIAMGVAVTPIIFTIAEDSLSNVPGHLRAGALALGSTPWQAALRVVLPTASPGIFSAIMVGFGRAVGETMIVLMATGNTPTINLSIFEGFRALSANIATELPEAAEGSTHYRTLFLSALILLGLTFVANTVAEWVRLRLRRRYKLL